MVNRRGNKNVKIKMQNEKLKSKDERTLAPK